MARPPRRLKAWTDAAIGAVTVAALKLLRRMNRRRMSNFLGRLMRIVGPWLPEHKVGRANLKAAFPDKSAQEIDSILAGVWENLGRVGAEFAHLDRMTVLDFERGGEADIVYDQISYERFLAVRDSGKPTIGFTASHLTADDLYAARHTSELEPRPEVVLSLDHAQRGLGTASCGPDTHPRYRLDASVYRFSYVLGLRAQ